MPFDLPDPTISCCLREFQRQAADLAEAAAPESEQIVERLCRLSREIRLRIGRPAGANPAQLQMVVQAFADVASAVSQKEGLSEQAQRYGDNIATRGDILGQGAQVPVVPSAGAAAELIRIGSEAS